MIPEIFCVSMSTWGWSWQGLGPKLCLQIDIYKIRELVKKDKGAERERTSVPKALKIPGTLASPALVFSRLGIILWC